MNICSITIFFILFCIVSLWIYSQNLLHFWLNEKERITILKSLGANKDILNRIYPTRDVGFMFTTLLFTNCILLFFIWFTSYKEMTNFVNAGTQWHILFSYGIQNTNFLVLFIPQIVYLIIFAYIEKKCNLTNFVSKL